MNYAFRHFYLKTTSSQKAVIIYNSTGFLMVSGGIEVNWFAKIRLKLEAKFGDNL